MYEKIKFDSTLSRKSPGIIQEHSPINFSRPSFDLGCFTPSPKSKSKKKVVEVDSIPHNKIKISPEKSDCSKISPSLKQQQLNMQNNRVSKEVVVPDFEKVDKRKKNVGQHDSDSDFEDEIFLPKMKKSKKNLVKMLELQGLRDIAFTNEEEVEFNLGVIHQDSLGHEHRNDSDHSVPSISEDTFIVLKNEIVNVESEFNGMREFVQESVKLILNELRLVKQNCLNLLKKSESFHWILVVFRIRHRCLYVYDSMMGGVIHSKNFLDYVRSLLTMMPMFLVATNFYGKRSDIDWHREAVYIDKSLSEPLDDCGMFVCDFAEYVSHDIFDISSRLFDAVNHRIRYGALLWDYARRKQNDGAISENEATGNVTSKHGGFKRSREQFGKNRSKHRNDPVTIKKLRDKAASKLKKSTSKASKKKFDDFGRPRLPKGMKYRIDKVPPHLLHMVSLCNYAFGEEMNYAFGEEMKEYFGEDVLGAFRNTIFGIFLDFPRCNWIGQISNCLLMLEIQHDNKDELHVRVQGKILKFIMLKFAIITGLKCTCNIDDYMYTSSSKSVLMSRYFFDNKEAITRSKLITRVQIGNFDNAEDALNLAILFFIQTFMFSQHKEAPISVAHFQIVEDESKIVVRQRNAIPRILNWSVECIRPEYESIMSGMFSKHSYKNIQPTTDEVSRLDLSFLKDFETCDPTTYASTSDSRKLKKTVAKLEQHVGTIAEEFGNFSTTPLRKILTKVDFASPVSPDQPLKKRKIIMFEQDNQGVMDDDTSRRGHAVHYGSGLYRETHKDASDKGEIGVSEIQHHHHGEIEVSPQNHQHKPVPSSSTQPEGTSKSSLDGDEIKNYINKCDVNAADKEASREDDFENEDCFDLQALEDEIMTYEEKCSDEELGKKNIPDVEDLSDEVGGTITDSIQTVVDTILFGLSTSLTKKSLDVGASYKMIERHRDLPDSQIPPNFPDAQDAVDFDKEEKLKYAFDGYTINQDFLNELMIDYSQWIAIGLLKTHSAKKETDNHYRVNASGLGYRQLKFVVAYPQFKNWFYLMSESKTCWNDEDCGVFVCAYAEILSEGLQVHSCGFDAVSQHARYASLLWHYGVEKTNEGYTSDNGDPPRPRKSVIEEIDASAIVTLE
ncbi:hypothetical protein T459_18357 [Capsicum annuum]|uniref:Ubiquitin-like protease family profile domain-containing protein n=1 Tax=Capsicum annuum TaxID=4072 RepID=A0A2G2ZEI7_CAPAN|nr:hypothetical protein T459_18357 [Capsicum annuum]